MILRKAVYLYDGAQSVRASTTVFAHSQFIVDGFVDVLGDLAQGDPEMHALPHHLQQAAAHRATYVARIDSLERSVAYTYDRLV
jgi:hypothetical protein